MELPGNLWYDEQGKLRPIREICRMCDESGIPHNLTAVENCDIDTEVTRDNIEGVNRLTPD